MTTMDPVDELLTPARVAEMFGVNAKTARRWCHQGHLRPVTRTLGGHWRFDKKEVDALWHAQFQGQK